MTEDNRHEVISFTQKCNNRCTMCTVDFSVLDGKDYTTDDIKKKIEKLDDSSDIVINGGEPTIRKDFFELLVHIRSKHPKQRIKLITNGRMLFYNVFIAKLKKISNIYVITELHGSTDLLHDNITRSKGSFKQTSLGIKNLIENNIPTELRIVISKSNYKDVEDIVKLYKEEYSDIDKIVIFPIDYIGNANRNIDECKIKITEIVPYIENAIDIFPQKIKLFHIPFCVIKGKYWKYIEGVTVKEHRVNISKECDFCIFKEKCPRIWKTYIKQFGTDEFQRIKEPVLK